MEYPMRKYGRNIYENYLSLLLNIASFTGFLFLLLAVIFFHKLFGAHSFSGGLVMGSLLLSAVLTGLASAGIRQNMALLEPACIYFFLTGALLIVAGFQAHRLYIILGGVLIILLSVLIVLCKLRAARQRFKPRFFSARQFETMVQVADTMLDTDGKEALNAIEIAINVDHLLSRVSSPATTDEIRTVIILIEWVLPILQLRPFPFSSLGSDERRKVIEKVIGSKGLFRNVAKAVKVLFCMGYYGDEKGMEQTGYIPFEERQRANQDQTPIIYKDPF